MARQSIHSHFYALVIRLMGLKQQVPWHNSARNSAAHGHPPRSLEDQHNVSSHTSDDHKVWTLAPKHRCNTQHVLFLHGGSYVQIFSPFHWSFLGHLIDRTGYTVIAPDYPLAPQHQAPETVRFVLEEYRRLAHAVGAHNVHLMGDSAGGGLALALAQQVRDAGLPQPASITLLCPWLDATLSNPDIQAVDALDPMLSVSGTRQAAKMYAGELALTDPLLSPIFGPLEELAPITMLAATHDILLPDCRKLKAQAEAKNIKLEYVEFERMFHDWMLFPIPEAKTAMDLIVKALERPLALRS